ncbi:signaling mucin HKR1-like, partial [Olea europaea subsp. europaea]
SYSPALSTSYTTASPLPVVSYSTPKPSLYNVASYSTTPAPYSPTSASYSPSVGGYSPSAVPYSPSPAPYSPSSIPHSPSPIPYSPSPIPYSPSPAPYSPSSIPHSPSPIPHSPSPAPYSPSPVTYSPSGSFASYSSAQPVSYTSHPKLYTPSSTVAPAIVSYSTPAPKTYYPTSTPIPVVQYSTPAPQTYHSASQYSSHSTGSLPVAGFPVYSQHSAGQAQYSAGQAQYSAGQGQYSSGEGAHVYSGQALNPGYIAGQYNQYSQPSHPVNSYSGSAYKTSSGSAARVQYSTSKAPGSYVSSTTEKGAYASPSSTPIAYSTTVSPINTFEYSTTKPLSYQSGASSYSGSQASDYSSSNRLLERINYSKSSNLGYPSANQVYSGTASAEAYSGDEYLPPLESGAVYDVKKPCDHPVPAEPQYGSYVPSQTFLGTGYESLKYSPSPAYPSPSPAYPSPSPAYVSPVSYNVPASYNAESFAYKPIVVQPLPDVSSFKDYFYSSVLPSSYTPAPIAYSTTPAYFSTASPIQYSTPSYVSSSTASPAYVSSYSTPKPVSYTPSVVSSTASPIYESSYVSSYSTPKPYSPTPAPYSPTYVSTTSAPIVDYSFGSSYTPRPVTYTPRPIVSTTATPVVYSTTAKPVTYSAATFESSRIFPSSTPSPPVAYPSTPAPFPVGGPVSYASYSSPPVVYGPSNLQPIRTYQSTGSYDVASYTATPKPCASANALDIADESKANAASLPDGTYVVGIKHQDKVVVVSRLSDFNPLLVEKLGATCDCHAQSQPIKIVRRRKIKSIKSTSANPIDDESKYNSNSIHSYNAYQVDNSPNVSPNVDIVSYNTQEEAEKSEQFHAPAPVHKSQRKYSSKTTLVKTTPSAVSSTTEKSYDEGHSHDGDDTLSITEFGTIECKRAGLFRHPKHCNKFYQCNWDEWKKKFTLHEFKCPIHLAYDSNIGACNWPSKGPACSNGNLLV